MIGDETDVPPYPAQLSGAPEHDAPPFFVSEKQTT